MPWLRKQRKKKNDESVLPKYDWRRENKKVSITICHCHDSKDPISTKDNTLCEVMWLASGVEMIVHTTVSLRYRPTETGSYSLLKGSSACVCKRKNPDSEDTWFIGLKELNEITEGQCVAQWLAYRKFSRDVNEWMVDGWIRSNVEQGLKEQGGSGRAQ